MVPSENNFTKRYLCYIFKRISIQCYAVLFKPLHRKEVHEVESLNLSSDLRNAI